LAAVSLILIYAAHQLLASTILLTKMNGEQGGKGASTGQT